MFAAIGKDLASRIFFFINNPSIQSCGGVEAIEVGTCLGTLPVGACWLGLAYSQFGE